ELVDEHRGVGERRILEQPVEQRGLAGAEKAGQHGEREGRERPARAAGGLRRHCAVGATFGFEVLACAVFGGAGFFAASGLASGLLASALAPVALVLSPLALACFFAGLMVAAFASASPLPDGFLAPVKTTIGGTAASGLPVSRE